MDISFRAVVFIFVQFCCYGLLGCHAPETSAPEEPEAEAIARTEFTDRIENFFEYEPLRPGQPSQVRIHLTDLTDGTPVDQAQVSLTVRPAGSGEPVFETTAKVGKVTGIYVAELRIPSAGRYDIEFHVRNARLDERLPLTDFRVE